MKIVKKSEIVKSSISSYLNNCFAIKIKQLNLRSNIKQKGKVNYIQYGKSQIGFKENSCK